MEWRSRIVGHEAVDPETLTGNPLNHRKHPQAQRDVVRDSIAEIGFVKSVLVNKTTGYIVDGHERVWQALDAKETQPGILVDVEYVELSEEEERKALAILDASTGMAEIDDDKLAELLAEVSTSSDAINTMLKSVSGLGNDIEELWQGMPEFENEDLEAWKVLKVHFKNEDDYIEFSKLIGQTLSAGTRAVWIPKAETLDCKDAYCEDEQ